MWPGHSSSLDTSFAVTAIFSDCSWRAKQAVLRVFHLAAVRMSTYLALNLCAMVSGDLLVEARRRAGMSRAELGRRSGVPASLIGRYERYEVIPSLERLRSLLRAAGFELSIRLAKIGRASC